MDICNISNATRHIGAPRNWDQKLDGSCAVLPVIDEVDVQSGANFMYSFHKPTAEELALLNAGGVIQLGIMGIVHPVVNLAVTELT